MVAGERWEPYEKLFGRLRVVVGKIDTFIDRFSWTILGDCKTLGDPLTDSKYARGKI
ncbi:hypothetical protein ACFL0D_08525 [Thermoproteota archaeon]